MNLTELSDRPFELLLELERRARAASAARQGRQEAAEDWVGIGFRLGAEQFVVARHEVREVMPIPDQVTRVPGAKPWLRGVANVRGQLLTIVDLKAFLGGGTTLPDRRARILVPASRDIPTGLAVEEVAGFKRFATAEHSDDTPVTIIRCEHYLEGGYRRASEVWPRFSLPRLLADEQFLAADATGSGVRAA